LSCKDWISSEIGEAPDSAGYFVLCKESRPQEYCMYFKRATQSTRQNKQGGQGFVNFRGGLLYFKNPYRVDSGKIQKLK